MPQLVNTHSPFDHACPADSATADTPLVQVTMRFRSLRIQLSSSTAFMYWLNKFFCSNLCVPGTGWVSAAMAHVRKDGARVHTTGSLMQSAEG